jgi:hypothetical protein
MTADVFAATQGAQDGPLDKLNSAAGRYEFALHCACCIR